MWDLSRSCQILMKWNLSRSTEISIFLVRSCQIKSYTVELLGVLVGLILTTVARSWNNEWLRKQRRLEADKRRRRGRGHVWTQQCNFLLLQILHANTLIHRYINAQIYKCTNRQIHKAQKPQNTNREGPGHYNTKVVNVLLLKLYFPVPYRTGQNA